MKNLSRPAKKNSFFHIYGPVPSRRLGFSLGIDIIPFKTCSFDCIYCQLGKAQKKKIERKEYFDVVDIISQIENILASDRRIDFITFSGSGEPTLNLALKEIIREIKKITKVSVAVLTNSSLLSREDVRQALQAADLVVPSLDAVTQAVFNKINRPHLSLKIEDIIQSLKFFRSQFKGLIWLEVMLVKGINDSTDHIKKLKGIIEEIGPDKVQLNTVIRPPAEIFAHSLTLKDLEGIKKMIGINCEIIAEFDKKKQKLPAENLEETIYAMIQRRPVTLSDISVSLGRHQNEVIKHLSFLLKEGKIKLVIHQGLKYYEPV